MNTIRQLCSRCIVLNHGHLVFDGDVEEAISLYMGHNSKEYASRIVVNPNMRNPLWPDPAVSIDEILAESIDGIINFGERLCFDVRLGNRTGKTAELYLRIAVRTNAGTAVTMANSPKKISIPPKQDKMVKICLDTSRLVPGGYVLSFALLDGGALGFDTNVDVLSDVYMFSVISQESFNHGASWNTQWWGNMAIDDLVMEELL